MPGHLSSAATRNPARAIALGKRCLRYLAGTRTHGIVLYPMASDGASCVGPRELTCHGDASYEEGYAQTGVLIQIGGMTVAWKSTKQVQVPRSTAEAEVTAMAYSGQYLEGVQALLESIGIRLTMPTLYCDNRAACYLVKGSNGWRTKALVNRVLGLRSLIELGKLAILYKPTAEMAADLLTKFMQKGVLQRCRLLIGCMASPTLQGVKGS